MKKLSGLAVLQFVALTSFAADPVVDSVSFSQRPGTKLVDITYTVSDADNDDLIISVEGQDADGAVSMSTLSGDGASGTVKPGTHTMTWDAGTDFPDTDCSSFRITLDACDIHWGEWVAVEFPGVESGKDRCNVTQVSANGEVLLAGFTTSDLENSFYFLSTDGGLHWNEIEQARDYHWYGGNISGNGDVIILSGPPHHILISSNRGQTWTSVNPGFGDNLGIGYWDTDLSWDGEHIVAGGGCSTQPTGVYLSHDSGNSWTEVLPVQGRWKIAEMSSDGQTILVGDYKSNRGRLYLSKDGGDSWAETQPDGDSTKLWRAGSMSANGQIMIVSPDYEYIDGEQRRDLAYRTIDGGINWEKIQIIDQSAGFHMCMSADGQTIVTHTWTGDGCIQISDDGGDTWSLVQPAGPMKDWTNSDMSADGKIMIIGAHFNFEENEGSIFIKREE